MGSLPRRFSPWLQGVLLYGLCSIVLSVLISAAPGFFGTDDYYHARMGTEIITQRRLALNFYWLPKTILSPERFVDHHLLYHLYIAPWTALGGMTGAKLATVSIAAGVFLAIWWLLRQIGVRYPVLWTLALFATSVPFFFRLLMIRTQGASLLLLIIALGLLFVRRYRWLLPLAFAYVWLYNGFVLILAFAGLSTVATWITEKRLDWGPGVYTVLGLILGLIINPYFPQNLQFISDHLGAKVDLGNSVRVGNEWYPYTTGALLSNSGGALLALAIGFLAPSFRLGRRDHIETTLLFVALLTLLMVFQSRRFIEYFPAFALLFAAAAWGRGPRLLPNWQTGFLVAIRLGTAAIVSFLVYGTLTQVYQEAQAAKPPEYLAGAAAWLRENTPDGTLIFQTDWDDFTRLFYYNTQNVYLVGLDPTYLEIADSDLWRQWVAITQGQVLQPSTIIQSQFGANYIVSDNQHEAFIRNTTHDPNLELVYQDKFSFIWHISEAVTAQIGE